MMFKPKEGEAEEDELDMMVLPLQDPQEATPPSAHVDGEEPIMADNPREDGEAMELLAETDEQAQDIAPPADNISRSTSQRRPPDRECNRLSGYSGYSDIRKILSVRIAT